jgi:hypothetical protein
MQRAHYRRTKETFTTVRITKLVSHARHTHDDHHFVRTGLFSKGFFFRFIPPTTKFYSPAPRKKPKIIIRQMCFFVKKKANANQRCGKGCKREAAGFTASTHRCES